MFAMVATVCRVNALPLLEGCDRALTTAALACFPPRPLTWMFATLWAASAIKVVFSECVADNKNSFPPVMYLITSSSVSPLLVRTPSKKLAIFFAFRAFRKFLAFCESLVVGAPPFELRPRMPLNSSTKGSLGVGKVAFALVSCFWLKPVLAARRCIPWDAHRHRHTKNQNDHMHRPKTKHVVICANSPG